MRPILLLALILTGCAAPRQQESSEAMAEQKQRNTAALDKQKERDNQALRLTVRQLYIQDHPELSAEFRKAILKERLKVGMNAWQVIASYSLWEYTTDPIAAKYKQIGALELWTLLDRRQGATAQTKQEQWALQREKTTRLLYFENGTLKTWKD